MKRLYSLFLLIVLGTSCLIKPNENRLGSFLTSFLEKDPNTCTLQEIGVDELNLMGVAYFANRENGKAIACFKKAAEKGSERAALLLKKIATVLKRALVILEVEPDGDAIDDSIAKLIDVFKITPDCPCHPDMNVFYDYARMFDLGHEYLRSDFLVKAAHCFTWGSVGLGEHQKRLTGRAQDQEIMKSKEYRLFKSLESKLLEAKALLLRFYDEVLLEGRTRNLNKTKSELV